VPSLENINFLQRPAVGTAGRLDFKKHVVTGQYLSFDRVVAYNHSPLISQMQ